MKILQAVAFTVFAIILPPPLAFGAEIQVFDKPIQAKVIRPGVVAVDAFVRKQELTDANALNLCIQEMPKELKVLHTVKGSSDYGTDMNWWYPNSHFRIMGANCLAGNSSACSTIQKHAMDWAKTSKLKKPRRNKDSSLFWNNTLSVNLWFLTPIIAALSVAEQFQPLNSTDRAIMDNWLKKIVDGNEHGMRLEGKYDGERHGGVYSRRAANNHAAVSSLVAISYGAWINNDKYFQTGIDQWFITFKSMRKDGSLPIETRRGARSLFYTGNILSTLSGIAETAAVQGINLYEAAPERNKTIHQAVRFWLDAVDNQKLIWPYAKANYSRGPEKNYKKQTFVWLPSSTAWIPMYMRRFPNHANTQRMLARKQSDHSQPRNYLTEQLDYAIKANGRNWGGEYETTKRGQYKSGEWVGVDVECFYAEP